MKFKGNVTGAIVSLAVFLAFAIAGGICLAAGFGDLVKNSDMINSVNDIVNYVDDFSLNLDLDGVTVTSGTSSQAEAFYERELSGEVENISIKAAGGDVVVSTGSKFSVSFKGRVSSGRYEELNENSVPAPGSGTSSLGYYENDGIIDASLNGHELSIDINSATTVVGFHNTKDWGRIVITVPADYTGSMELNGSLGEIEMTGLTLDELTIDGCLGEVDINRCGIQRLIANNLLGEVDTEGSSVYSVELTKILGELNLDSNVPFSADSKVTNVLGEVHIELPRGTRLNVYQDDVLGDVSVDRAITGSAGDPAIEISDVMGEVSIELDD